MRIRLTTCMVGKGLSHQRGDEIDVDERQARRLVNAGYAVALDALPPDQTGTQPDPDETATEADSSETATEPEADQTATAKRSRRRRK